MGRSASVLLVVLSLAVAAEGRELTHVVEPGQTLWSIAHAYGIKVEDLMADNGLSDPTQLPVDTKLTVRTNDTGKGPRPPRTETPTPRAAGRFDWPLKGVLTSHYGRRWGRKHTGIDIAAPRGTIVVAAAEGRATRAGDRWGRYGNVVLIDHGDGYKTLYAHLARAFIEPGARVSAGQAVGAVGATGNATGPHLHFEVWKGDATLNPSRLLPPLAGSF